MTMLSAGDLGAEIDFEVRNPSGTLQRLESGIWENCCPDGQVVSSEALDIESLPPGKYRVVPIS
jgi:hypothetical protein